MEFQECLPATFQAAIPHEETSRSRFPFVCSHWASCYGAVTITVLLFTAALVSADVALAVLLTEPSATSCALMV